MSTTDTVLFDETFTLTNINSEKYDRVSRITGLRDDLNFHLDINHDLYPCSVGETVQIVLASSLSLDGTNETEQSKSGWREIDEGGTLADSFDYVCYGKIYRFEEASSADSIKVYASFGGLLLYLEGSAKKLTNLKHEYIYLLMKK